MAETASPTETSLPEFPTEVWDEILSFAVTQPLPLPSKNASLFEDLDLFGHPCKLASIRTNRRMNPRLVCRLWNDIIQRFKEEPLSIKGYDHSKPLSEDVYSEARVDLVGKFDTYCLKWPCKLTRRSDGRCPQGKRAFPPASWLHDEDLAGEIKPAKLRVVRLLDVYQNPASFLNSCPDLEALWIRHASFRASFQSGSTLALSHLHLDSVDEEGGPYSLDLPCLVHIELNLFLSNSEITPTAFPLDIQMPNVKTVLLNGTIGKEYWPVTQQFILSAKTSVVNLLIAYGHHDSALPFGKLAEFPHLSTLGVPLATFEDLTQLLPPEYPPVTPASRLQLIILDLDGYHRFGASVRKKWMEGFVKTFSKVGNWFSDIVIPFEWKELKDLWVQACECLDRGDGFDETDPLPCLWSCLDHMVRHLQHPIVDRNGVSLRVGDGAAFAYRMQSYMTSGAYKERRRAYVNLVAGDRNIHPETLFRDSMEDRDWVP